MPDTTWVSTLGLNYLAAKNWSDNVPDPSNNGIFGLGPPNPVKLVEIPGSTTAGGWIFNGGAYEIELVGMGPFTVHLSGAGIQGPAAGSALIDVTSNSGLDFDNQSSAGAATIEVQSNAGVDFNNNSSGGTARLIVNFDGQVNFYGPVGSANVAGSIEGSGFFLLWSHPLTVGGNNLSTTVTGQIAGGLGSALTKVGTGTLTLAGVDTFTGALTIAGGTVDLASLDADFGGRFISFDPGVTLRIESAALPANDFHPVIHAFGHGDTINLPSLAFVPGATATYNTSSERLVLASGGTTVTFDTVDAPAWTNFVALSDDAGGTKIVLAITATHHNQHIDAKHHPVGQPALSGRSNVIVALGANDVIKPPGGNNTEVGGAHGDVLYGGTGDSFVFETLKASPPSHPDQIIGFKHAQHEQIDLYDLRLAVPGDQPLVFIGAQTFAHYHRDHPTVFGMVRYAGGEVQVSVNHHLANEFEIVMYGAPPLHASDFIL